MTGSRQQFPAAEVSLASLLQFYRGTQGAAVFGGGVENSGGIGVGGVENGPLRFQLGGCWGRTVSAAPGQRWQAFGGRLTTPSFARLGGEALCRKSRPSASPPRSRTGSCERRCEPLPRDGAWSPPCARPPGTADSPIAA